MKKYLGFLFIICSLLSITSFSQTPGSLCDSLSSKAIKLFQQQNYKEAVPVLERTLKVCSRDTALADTDYYVLLAGLAVSYHEINLNDSAFYTGRSAISYFEKTNQTMHFMYGELANRLGIILRNWGDFKEAIVYFEKATSVLEKLPKQYETYMWVAQDLARCYSEIGEFEKAMNLNRKLQNEILLKNGKQSMFYIGVLTNIGNDFIRFSNYDSALAYHSESLQLREQLVGKKHHEYAKGLAIVGAVYKNQNRFSDAIAMYEQAKQIYQDGGYAKTLDYARVLNGLGSCYSQLSLYEKGFEVLNESLKILRIVYGDTHPQVAEAINNIASLQSSIGLYKEAIANYSYAKRILEKTIGKENPQYASILSNLGSDYSTINKFDSAFFFLNQSLVIKEKIFGKDHPELNTTLNSLANVYSDTKDFSKALDIYNRILSIEEKRFGKGSFSTSIVHNNIALLHWKNKNDKLADQHLNTSYEVVRSYILGNTEGLSETDKEGFAQDIRLTNYVALSLRRNSELNNAWLYNSSLFYKGLLLEGSRGLTSAFANLTDTSLKRKAKDYSRLKAFIGQQLLTPENRRSKQLPEYIDRSAILERELLQASSAFRNWKQQFNVKWEPIQKSLKADEASIEFVSYHLPNAGAGALAHYAALIVKPEVQDPMFVPLFSEVDFNKLISKSGSSEAVVKKLYRSTIKSASSQPQPSDSLYHLIWKPLLPHLQNVKSIYFAADGVINNLNLAAIIKPDGKRLVEDYEFIQLSSTRNMLKNSPQPTFNNIQLWGGVQYDGTAATSATRSAAFTYLPGTLTEINDIVSTAGQSNKKTKTFVAAEANEAAFKNLDGNSPEVLHIATHGFFFPEPSKEIKTAENRFAQSANPLLRSGLALANANQNWQNALLSGDKEDGILTAYEIADMDLSNTKLVVLSACETGLGDVKSGEGVYGLQRAFKMAGVNYLIMSLWQVPDLETKEFMQTFYKHCLAGMSIRKAFRETQLAMNTKYQPYQWAAFVLVE